MLYAALTFWLFVILFTAWGVHRIWSNLVKPRTVNIVLLPGTLVAQLGRVLGLLITGNAVKNTALMGDDDKGDPKSDVPDQQRLPIVGPILIGLLPLVACACCLYISTNLWGGRILTGLSGGSDVALTQQLPKTVGGFWELLHNGISLMQNILLAIMNSDLPNFKTVGFLYLAVCLTVRMAPFDGNRRGAIGAIALTGLLIAVAASLMPSVRELVLQSWRVLSLAVAMLLFLLLLSLLASGVVALIRVMAGNEGGPSGGAGRRRTPSMSAARE